MSARNLWIGLLRRYSTYLSVRLSRRPPVLVYQMGKVASSAVRNSLLLHGVGPVLHLHSFFPLRDCRVEEVELEDGLRPLLEREVAHARRIFAEASSWRRLRLRYREKVYNEEIHRLCIASGRPVRIITLVRDPAAANLSMFFQVFEEYVGRPYAPHLFSVDELAELFLERYDHSRPLTWFDAEMRRSTGLDVYGWSFPRGVGWTTIRAKHVDLLILQCELSDQTKEEAISEFLGLEGFGMMRSNVGGEKIYADQYRQVKERIELPEDLLNLLYGSRYSTHFYAAADRARFHERWAGASSP